MKKYLILLLIGSLFLCGCGKYDKNEATKDFSKKVNKIESYNLKGMLEIVNNEDIIKYKVEVAYREGDYYKVKLKNVSNNHEQIILKNDNGVYVITPSLNKSFKFQSEWPNNSSQAYILSTLINDLENDKGKTFVKKDKKYVFTTSVNYPNNRNLTKEVITLNKKMDLSKVEVLNEEGITIIKFKVTEFNKNIKYKKSYFSLKNSNKSPATEQTTSKELDEVIYPMYLPKGTELSSEEKVNEEGTERTILTFSGDKPFTLVQENATVSKEFEIEPVYGEPTFVDTALGSLTNTSLSWATNGKEYYLVGENLSEEELVSIASSTIVSSSNK